MSIDDDVAQRTIDAMLAAQQRWNDLPQDIKDKVIAMREGITDLLSRTFCSPANSKGRQTFYFATDEEIEEWRNKQ